MEVLKRSVRPEFLNRIDEVIMFEPLSPDNIRGILMLQISQIQQMLQEQDATGIHSEEMLISLLTHLLVLLERDNDSPAKSPLLLPICASENQIIQRAQQYISAHVREKLTVPGIAAGIDVSASYLTALFNKHLQISPGEYLRRIKLQESKQMIREGNLNMTQIAAELQYSTIHHFSRQFKEKFGITPSEYARSIR